MKKHWGNAPGNVYPPNVFHWQRGYGAFSVGQSNVGTVKRYIRNQKEHHKRVSFQDEYREFLKRYEIDFDERYVWDEPCISLLQSSIVFACEPGPLAQAIASRAVGA